MENTITARETMFGKLQYIVSLRQAMENNSRIFARSIAKVPPRSVYHSLSDCRHFKELISQIQRELNHNLPGDTPILAQTDAERQHLATTIHSSGVTAHNLLKICYAMHLDQLMCHDEPPVNPGDTANGYGVEECHGGICPKKREQRRYVFPSSVLPVHMHYNPHDSASGTGTCSSTNSGSGTDSDGFRERRKDRRNRDMYRIGSISSSASNNSNLLVPGSSSGASMNPGGIPLNGIARGHTHSNQNSSTTLDSSVIQEALEHSDRGFTHYHDHAHLKGFESETEGDTRYNPRSKRGMWTLSNSPLDLRPEFVNVLSHMDDMVICEQTIVDITKR